MMVYFSSAHDRLLQIRWSMIAAPSVDFLNGIIQTGKVAPWRLKSQNANHIFITPFTLPTQPRKRFYSTADGFIMGFTFSSFTWRLWNIYNCISSMSYKMACWSQISLAMILCSFWTTLSLMILVIHHLREIESLDRGEVLVEDYNGFSRSPASQQNSRAAVLILLCCIVNF